MGTRNPEDESIGNVCHVCSICTVCYQRRRGGMCTHKVIRDHCPHTIDLTVDECGQCANNRRFSQLCEIASMIPDLEDNKATKYVARKLLSILKMSDGDNP